MEIVKGKLYRIKEKISGLLVNFDINKNVDLVIMQEGSVVMYIDTIAVKMYRSLSEITMQNQYMFLVNQNLVRINEKQLVWLEIIKTE
jgi:hypothetical protein